MPALDGRVPGSAVTRSAIGAAIALAALAACAKGADPSAEATPSAMARMVPAKAVARATATAAPGAAREVSVKNDLYEFAYAYPAAAGGIRPLKTLLDGELDRMRAELVAEATSGRADAAKNAYPYHAHSSEKTWSVVTELPQWLSLSAKVYTYSGGAHGMTVFDTLLWDKRAGVRRYPIDLFVSKASFRAAVAKPLCTALNRERLKRRAGETWSPDDQFSRCIDPIDDAAIILGSHDHAHFDRIGFLIPPYNAGPYAEGTYEVTLPVTPALLAALKPGYRAAFAAR